MSTLSFVSESSGQAYYLPDGAVLVVGRGTGCDMMIPNPNVSRRHAELRVGGSHVHIRDLGSSNGTFVNGDRSSDGVAHVGDVVTFGTASFRLNEGALPEGRPEPDLQRASAPRSASGAENLNTGERQLDATAAEPPPRDQGDTARTRVRPLGDSEFSTVLHRLSTASEADATADEHSQPSARALRGKLDALLGVAAQLLQERDVKGILRTVAERSLTLFQADRVAILLRGRDDELHPAISMAGGEPVEPRMVPRSIAMRAIEERAAILTSDAGSDARFTGESVQAQLVRSAICVPLTVESGTLGVLYVDSISPGKEFSENDVEVAVAFAGVTAAAVERERLADRLRHEAVVRSSFERYFAPALAAEITAHPERVRLGGEHRQVAVLFSDIRGFSAWSEHLPAEETARILSEYFGEMVECVFATGGTLDKFIGDALMAQWGAPVTTGDDAGNALRCARLMHERLTKLNRRLAADSRPILEVGTGISFGEVFAGNIGSARRLEYTVIGDVVNVASRLASLAAPAELLLAQEAFDAMGGSERVPEAEALEQLQVRGRTRNVRVFRVRLDSVPVGER